MGEGLFEDMGRGIIEYQCLGTAACTCAEDLIDPPYTQGAFMAFDISLKDKSIIAPTITTVKKKNGAIAMFYPGVLEKLAEICGGSYYVSFTSIHDVRIHPISTVQPRRILRSLKM